MLYIAADNITPRLTYTLDWIFREQLGIAYTCLPPEETGTATRPLLNYSSQSLPDAITIKPQGILYGTDIREMPVAYHRWKHTAIIFYNQPGAPVPFDLFGAVFFMLSRYEEYLPGPKDKHGRFHSSRSVAAAYAFLKEPVADLWVWHLGQLLHRLFGLSPKVRTFTFLPTFDIDTAYNYLDKPLWKHLLGSAKDLAKGKIQQTLLRYKVCRKQTQDPYDNFEWMKEMHQKYRLKPVYFWLLSDRRSSLDPNNDTGSERMQQLLQHYRTTVTYGIHPSYNSHRDPALIKKEIQTLAPYYAPVTKSRQHYIKFTLPDTYRLLIAEGITEEYSMGYADSNGFRAGTSNPFQWFDLCTETSTDLKIYPFVFMEATSIFYGKQSPEQAFEEVERLYWAIRKTGSMMITIFHNYTLGTAGAYKGWRRCYQNLLDLATDNFEPKPIL